MPKYYVYELAYPDNVPFYRGKGTGNRIDIHEEDARRSEHQTVCNPRKISIIKDIQSRGEQVRKRKLAFFDDEQEAYMYEWAMIYMTTDAELLVNGQNVCTPSNRPTEHMNKTTSTIRLSDEAMRLRALLAQSLGISRVAVLELAIREAAKEKGIN